jgi:hypothetical protein
VLAVHSLTALRYTSNIIKDRLSLSAAHPKYPHIRPWLPRNIVLLFPSRSRTSRRALPLQWRRSSTKKQRRTTNSSPRFRAKCWATRSLQRLLAAGDICQGSGRPRASLPFAPRPDDVIVASLLKCSTTWVIALTVATMVGRVYPANAVDHPLRRLNPHQCLSFLETLFSDGKEAMLDALPSPRLMNTHMPLDFIPRAVGSQGCKVVYV